MVDRGRMRGLCALNLRNITNQRGERMVSGGNKLSGKCGKITHEVSIALDYHSPVDISGGSSGL